MILSKGQSGTSVGIDETISRPAGTLRAWVHRAMISEQEIRILKEELAKLTGFIGEHGIGSELQDKDFQFACNASDTLSWVLGEITTECFTGSTYINLFRPKHIARAIEIRTGKKLADYE